MNKNNLLRMTIVIVAVVLVYLILKSRKKQPTLANGQGPIGDDFNSDDFTGGGGNLGSNTQGVPQDVGCSSNCCQQYSEDVDTENPISNLGTCGVAIYEFQQWLNGWANSQGLPLITEDGAYGPNTLQQHQALIVNQTIPPFTNL